MKYCGACFKAWSVPESNSKDKIKNKIMTYLQHSFLSGDRDYDLVLGAIPS